MKIICQYTQGGASFTLPETALGREGQPFFVPDDLGVIVAVPVVMVPIVRLGKHIARQFAHRYYKQWSAGVLFVCKDRLGELRREGLPWADAFAFDGALRAGQWRDMDVQTTMQTHHLRLTLADNASLEMDVPSLEMDVPAPRDIIDTMIQRESKWNTLRQGDYLLFQLHEGDLTIKPEQMLRLWLDNEKVLHVKLK